jgi:F-type H+-transporting ATPase subunit b
VLASILVLASEAVTTADNLLNQQAEEVKAVKNPILPTVNEMFWAAIFFIALWALMKFVLLPRITSAMDARAEKIRADQAAAEAAEVERTAKLEQYEAGLAGARSEAIAVLEAARSEGDAVRREQIAAAEAEVASVKASAAAEVAEAKDRARRELAGSITDIAVGAAEAVVQKSIDRSAQTQLVEDYINGAGRN